MESFKKYMNGLKIIHVAVPWLLITLISVYEQYAVFVNTGSVHHFFRPSNLLYSFMSILFCWKLCSQSNFRKFSFLLLLGRYSFGIYLVHIPILHVIYHRLTKPYYGTGLGELVTFLACVVASFIFTFGISKIKIGTLAVGKIG